MRRSRSEAGSLAARGPRRGVSRCVSLRADRVRRLLRVHELERAEPRALGRPQELPRHLPRPVGSWSSLAHARARRLFRRRRQRDRPCPRARAEPDREDAAFPAAAVLPARRAEPSRDLVHLALDLRLPGRPEPRPRRRRPRFVATSLDRRSLDRALDDPRRHDLAVLGARDGAVPRRLAGDPRRCLRSNARRRRVRLAAAAQGRPAAARAGRHGDRDLHADHRAACVRSGAGADPGRPGRRLGDAVLRRSTSRRSTSAASVTGRRSL